MMTPTPDGTGDAAHEMGGAGTGGERRLANGAALVELLELGAAQTKRGLAVFPLFAKTDGGPWYVTLAEAIAGGQASITEVDEGGSVPNLSVVNKGDARILVLDGEEVRGAKQNRILNTTILVGKHSSLVIPVSCTEYGRWHYEGGAAFSPAEFVAERDVRREMRRTVNAAVVRGDGHRASQGEVWDRVALFEAKHGVHSPTGAQHDTFQAKKPDLDRLLRAFPLVDGQQGMLVVHGDEVVGLDLVSIPEKYARLHEKLLRSYAFEALVSDRKADGDPARGRGFLKRIADLHAQSFKSPGLGWDLRFEGNGVLGSVLTYRGRAVHAAFFDVGGVAGAGRGAAGDRGGRVEPQPRPEPQWRIADARERARRRQAR
jgi:hypothetical protein